MNTHALKELVDFLIASDEEFGVQRLLEQARNELRQLANSPQEQSFQIAYAKTFEELREAYDEMRKNFTPARAQAIEEIEAADWFLYDLPTELRELTSNNPLTPAVIREYLDNEIKQRKEFLATLSEISGSLEQLGIEATPLEPETAEIGFRIPRAIFHNHLDEFAKELAILNNAVRILSEIATGSPQPAEIHQISTSDPTIFLGLDISTITMLGNTVTWALATLTSVYALKTLREQAANTKAFTDEEMADFFDAKAKKAVEAAVEAEANRLIQQRHPNSRKDEVNRGVTWALETIFSRIERGVTVELRFLPPSAAETATAESKKKEANFRQLEKIASAMKFPELSKNPILEIPPAGPPKPPSKAVKLVKKSPKPLAKKPGE